MTKQQSSSILSEWYELIISSPDLLQGDILEKCPIFLPPKGLQFSAEINGLESEFLVEIHDVVIMSQSCDMVLNRKQDMWLVILCPLWKLSSTSKIYDFLNSNYGKEQCRRGYMPGLHMLSGCEHDLWKQEILIVSFQEIYSLPLDFVRHFAENKTTRPRLRSPYREHLAQAFARYFMRVGLPTDIPSFNSK